MKYLKGLKLWFLFSIVWWIISIIWILHYPLKGDVGRYIPLSPRNAAVSIVLTYGLVLYVILTILIIIISNLRHKK